VLIGTRFPGAAPIGLYLRFPLVWRFNVDIERLLIRVSGEVIPT